MTSLKALKNRIASVKSTKKITEATPLVASENLRRSAGAAKVANLTEYSEAIRTGLTGLLVCAALVSCAPKNAAAPAATEAGVAAPAASGEGAPPADEAPAEEAAPPAGEEDLCKSADYQSLIGTNAAAVTLPAELPHRILGPNDAATMDFRADRLNILTDDAGIVIEVKCG